MRWSLDTAGMRLAHASMSFGAGESGAGDAQILNIGGSVQRLDLGGWLRLSTLDKDCQAAVVLHARRQAQCGRIGLSWVWRFAMCRWIWSVAERSWRINVGGPNVIGAITIPSAEGSTEPWSLQFDRLHFDVGLRDDVRISGRPAALQRHCRRMPIRTAFRRLISTPRN